MIYDKFGNTLSSAYDLEGNQLSQAYDKSGNKVFNSQPAYDYDDYSISNVLFSLSGSSFQSFTVHDGVIAQFQADDKINLINSINGSVIASQMYCKSYHGQSSFFLNDYYDEDDEFPLLMVMGSYVNSWINRITRSGTNLVKTIYIPTTIQYGGYKLGNAFDAEHNVMYMLGYTNQNYQTDDGGTNKLIISKWDLSNLTDNGDDTFTPELISTVQRDFLVCIQGSCYYDGMIWATSGYGSGTSHVYALDPATAEILHTITLSSVEVEGCAWVDDYLLVGQSPSNISYKKVTFAEA